MLAQVVWDIFPFGMAHPALMCAALYGRLGEWAMSVEILEGVLAAVINPCVHVEALRQLGQCRAATGERGAACDAAERAVAEAGRAGYAWLEMRALRDLRGWCEPAEAAAVCVRLDEVVGRLAATPAELSSLFPE